MWGLGLLLGGCLTSCFGPTVVGATTDYDRLVSTQKSRVLPTSAPIDSLRYGRNVYVVGIGQVKDFIAAHDTVDLLFWVPYQRSERSVPIRFEEACAARRATPCILLTSFFWEQMPLADSLSTPVLFVDVRPYGTDVVSEYLKAIVLDLTGLDLNLPEDRKQFRMPLTFRGGRYLPPSDADEAGAPARRAKSRRSNTKKS